MFPLTRLRALVIMALLFAASVAVRQPLFNHDFTASWEWLSAHTLLTSQLWSVVPSEIHHYNLLYSFPGESNRFIDDLWGSGVADRLGNYYYVSMPHLAFLTPYLFFRATGQAPTIAGLQVFALLAHLVACGMIYLLVRRLTSGWPSSRYAALAAFCVLLFAPTALFFYQNAVVGTILVIPYTIGVVLALDYLIQPASSRARRIAWIALFLCLLLGCLTDWQAYFTAFAVFLVVIALALRKVLPFRTAAGIAVLCCTCVALAIALTVLQDARIDGFEPFFQTIFGRLKVRSGRGAPGLGLNTLGYYRNLARFYSAYLHFVAFGALLLWLTRRRAASHTNLAFHRISIPLFVTAGAVLIDHLVLANHTSEQSFTTLNSLVPICIFAGWSVATYLDSLSLRRRQGMFLLVGGMSLCIVLSVGEYYFAYRNRPQPYRPAAAAILASTQPGDVLFATGAGFRMPVDYMIPQILFYTRANIKVVDDRHDAETFLRTQGRREGVLLHLTKDYTLVTAERLSISVNF